ncbi:di-trans,poly-cis-decaprenylcistransferas-like protein [Delitschia confertaspora ATCC 74209]|uniref:ditrans,polycis-polyprenyl diphosphate synthase [(2E,6E)-farnesyldiphosphate specific] n=1 Tax=Delitschia confertaspora ATCC 74209 TaxID=1513339 RepID=A0A9P4MSS7_9PLEO|nr:di-trans,poly-cis-decaprenylcistransferas-like protein [Delitschia confertaspora ATCC 74209]
MATTGIRPVEATAFHRNMMNGKHLTPREREELLKPFLPDELSDSSLDSPNKPSTRRQQSSSDSKSKPSLFKHWLFVLTYTVIHAIFSVYFRFRRAYHLVVNKVISLIYYHHRTPEFIQRDVRKLQRLPAHVSVLLDFHESDEDQGSAGLEGLVNDVCEIVAWCACAGIPFLSVYEKRGILKNCIPQTHDSISSTLESYFGSTRKPTLALRAPHIPSYSPPITPPRPSTPSSPHSDTKPAPNHINVLLLSSNDGRDTMVDLTKTLAEMAQKDSLNPQDISTDLIDIELTEAVSGEPDLLILFSPTVELKGYPPWQLRLTEIFHVPDNKGVNYQVFIRALHNYSKCEMRLGR